MDGLLRRNFCLVKLVAIGCIAALALSAAWRFNTVAPVLEDLGLARVASSPLGREQAGKDAGQLAEIKGATADAIAAHSLFCPACGMVPPSPPSPESPLSGLIPSALPLTLLGTMQAEDPQESMATLLNTETATLAAYRVSDTVYDRVWLDRVERGRVILRNGERAEYIDLAGTPRHPDTGQDTGARAHASGKPEHPISCRDENTCTISRSFVDKLLANPRSLANDAQVVPAVRDGETQGFKFYAIKAGSLPKLLGVKNGDVLSAVNGIQLSSLDAAMQLYTKLRSAKHVSLIIDRQGAAVHKEIDIE